MVEWTRLLPAYRRDHHVAVDVMVEFGIVSTLREVVLRGVVELRWEQALALAAFLLALGLLLRFWAYPALAQVSAAYPGDAKDRQVAAGQTISQGSGVQAFIVRGPKDDE